MARRFPLVVVVLGAAVTLVPFVAYLGSVPEGELGVELSSGGVGALLLFSPYIALAVLGRRARPLVGYGALALLLVGSAVFLAVASSDPQGALIALYTLPLQWLVVACTLASRSSAPPADAPPAGD